MKTKAKAGEKATAKVKKPAVKTAKKTVKKTAAAPKAAKVKTAGGRKTGIGKEIDKALSFCKSITLKDITELGEEGRKKLSQLLGEIVGVGERLLKLRKKTKKG